MSIELDSKLAATGSRFRLFPQSPSLAAYRQPETVRVSSPAGSLRPGPSDERMQVFDAIDKQPYDDDSLPPWRGPLYPPAEPDAEGNFDHYPVGSRAFNAAHMFGAVRRVLDIWQDYFETEINLTSLLEPSEPADRADPRNPAGAECSDRARVHRDRLCRGYRGQAPAALP